MTTAILVAAGRGTRMGPDVDKLFLEVAGAPVVAHTWRRFDLSPAVHELVIVVRDGMQSAFQELAAEHGFRKPHRFVVGGKERQDSVWNGLLGVSSGTELVAIQDGARPCTDAGLIRRCLDAARRSGASVAAQRATDTIKESDDTGRIARHLDRSRLWTVQTPQCFRLPILLQALSAVRDRGLTVTDDTAACEYIGQSVELVESMEPNPKVTTRGDLPLVEVLLREMTSRGAV